ncbi:MAG: hypothetical protein J0L87_06800 [Bacteroidetes bacterium]|nr:hypothetical protein [Bacteroidota bacterium]
MYKTILIPIDFCVASLNTLKVALEENKGQPIKIVLLYSEYLNDSIQDLLFYSPNKIINSKKTTEFNEALEILCNRFGLTQSNICIRLLHNNKRGHLEPIIQIHNVTSIYIPEQYQLNLKNNAFDPIPLLGSLPLDIHKVKWNYNNNKSEQEQLTSLFN